MSRNEDKVGAVVSAPSPVLATQNDAGKKKEEETKTFSFPEPTTFVELPTLGKFYSTEHLLHGQKDLEIKFMTAQEEDILANQSYIKKGVVLNKLLKSLIKNKSVDVSSLYVCDRNAIAIEARINGFGSDYTTYVACPNCEAKVKPTFDLSELKIKRDRIDEIGPDGCFTIILPKTNVETKVKLLLGSDETWIQQMAKNKKSKKIPETPLLDIMSAFIVSVNGEDSKRIVQQFLKVVPAQDSKYLREQYAEIIPGFDMRQEFECPECSQTAVVEVPLTSQFFRPDNS